MKQQFLALSLLASTTLGALGGISPAQAAIVFDKEPNSTDGTAQKLPDMGTSSFSTFTEHVVKGSVSNSDRDFYRVYIAKLHLSTFRITSSNANSLSPVFVDLYYDANDNDLAETSERVESASSSLPARALEGMPAGTYFIKVSKFFSNVATYDLTLRATTTAPRQVEIEPNSRPEQANVVKGLLVGARYLQGSVNSNVDGLDYYRFKVGNARIVTISLFNILSSGQFSLYHDKNLNGRIDGGEFLQHKAESGGSASMTRFLQTGEYIIEVVKPFGSGSASYLLYLYE